MGYSAIYFPVFYYINLRCLAQRSSKGWDYLSGSRKEFILLIKYSCHDWDTYQELGLLLFGFPFSVER